MDDERTRLNLSPTDIIWLATGALLFIGPVVLVLADEPIVVCYFGGLIVFTASIFAFVRRLNRRVDPRHSKRPSDAP